MNKSLPYWLAALLSAALVWLLWFSPPDITDVATELPPPRGGDFTLLSAQGPVALADWRGKVLMLYFGYTWCPDVCPTNLGFISAGLGQLSAEEVERVRVLFISIDPQRDTPQRLGEYVAFFHPNIIGLTGDAAALARVAALYGVVYHKVAAGDSAAGYFVDHSADTYLLDAQGRWRRSLPHASAPAEIAAALRALLRESA